MPPPPGDLPHEGFKPAHFTSPVLAGGFFTTSTTWEVHFALPKNLFLLSSQVIF